jgi:hypothetical protein
MDAGGVFLISVLLVLGFFAFKAWLEKDAKRERALKALKTTALVRGSPRLSYLQRINLAKECVEEPDGSLAHALVVSLKRETESFYGREWTVEEAQRELRLLAKDIEMAQGSPAPKKHHSCEGYSSNYCEACVEHKKVREVYTQAVSLELLDSIGDLERKAQHLLGTLMRLDYSAFVFSVAQDGMRQLAEKFKLRTEIKRDLQELHAATLTNLQVDRERLRLEADALQEQLRIAVLQKQIQEVK